MEVEVSKKTVLVTGGAGFVGSHLCKALHEAGHHVISIDNYFTGSQDNHHQGVTYIEGHTKDIAVLLTVVPDVIYHLGEYSRVAESMKEPAVVWDLNIAGTHSVLEYCREQRCKLVYAGSSTKFADERVDGVAGRDLAPYTWMKAVNSEFVVNYGRWYDFPCAVTYFYNVYGPGELAGRYGTVIEIFKQRMLAGEKAKVNGPGTQTRAYTHVADTVAGLILVGEQGEGDEFGIGADDVYSPLELCELFGLEYDLMPERKTSRPSSHVDSKKLRALGWKPQHTLKSYVEHIKTTKLSD